jgi:4-hydroxy-tetrahydrodipicolinate synthase
MTESSRRDFLKISTVASGSALAGGLSQAALAQAAPQDATATVQSVSNSKTAGQGCPAEVRAALSGPWPSIRTPFTRQGDIDFDSLRKQIDFYISEAKAKAVVLTWGDSLFSILTETEIAQIAKVVVEHVNRRAFVVAATGTWWTGKAVEFAKYCAEIRADMLMVLPPDWAASTTIDTLVAHYRAVSEHIPVMLVTNYLGARGVNFALDLCKRLFREAPGVMAVKDDVCGEFICKLCVLAHDHWAMSAGGMKKNHLLMLPYGADGYLSSFLTFKPEIAWRYWKAVESGNLQAAGQVVRDYDMPLFDYILKSEGSFDAAIHGIDELFGLGKRYRRPPYYSLNDKQLEDLAEYLCKLKIL